MTLKRISISLLTNYGRRLLDRMKRRITVFGSGIVPPASVAYREAYELGRLLGEAGFTYVCGGYGGTMEAGAKGASDAGAKTLGVIVEKWGPPNPYISKTLAAPDLFARLKKLMELGDGYVILRGATGTLVELALAWERANKGLDKRKPIVLMGDFWLPVVEVVGRELSGISPESPSEKECLFGDFLWRVETPFEAVRLLKELLALPCKKQGK